MYEVMFHNAPLAIQKIKKYVDTLEDAHGPIILAGTGMSGTAAIAAIKAHDADNDFRIFIVRKEHDDTHSMCRVETSVIISAYNQPVVFIDDLIDTGATQLHVIKQIYKRFTHARYEGTFLMARGFFQSREEIFLAYPSLEASVRRFEVNL